MADKSINQLPVSAGLTDDGLLVVYQNDQTKSIRGDLIRRFAEQGIEAALAEAKASGEFDGEDGYTPVKGVDYFDGKDAVSPTIAVSDITGGHRITITDKNGTKTIDVMDGDDGYTPQKNVDYFDGRDGNDGVSPTITVTNIDGGHRLTITDANGRKTIDIMDGTDGTDGVSIQSIERTAGTGAAGTTDTYTITLSNGYTTTFQVYNGADGEGAGDMLANVYDPQGKAQDVFAYVDNSIPTVPTNVSAFTNDAGYITDYTETDPTVPAWAKSPAKPTYTASEVGAIGSSQKGTVGGVASLGNDGKVPTSQLPATMPPSAHKASHMTGGSDALRPSDIGAAEKSTTVTATLSASGWADGVYVLSVNGVTATSNQELLPAVDITAEQLAALQGANIQDGGQTAGNITLKAYGDVPTIDIPIRVIKRGD